MGKIRVGDERVTEGHQIGIAVVQDPVGFVEIIMAGDDDRAPESSRIFLRKDSVNCGAPSQSASTRWRYPTPPAPAGSQGLEEVAFRAGFRKSEMI